MLAAALQPWEQLVADGLSTALERFESADKPTRSECHPWSIAPVYAYYRLIAGLNFPDAKSVTIEPYLGTLKTAKETYPHPLGNIQFEYEQSSKGLRGFVEIPDRLAATLVVNGKSIRLKPGRNELR